MNDLINNLIDNEGIITCSHTLGNHIPPVALSDSQKTECFLGRLVFDLTFSHNGIHVSINYEPVDFLVWEEIPPNTIIYWNHLIEEMKDELR